MMKSVVSNLRADLIALHVKAHIFKKVQDII
jgi:hypothetical protein